MNPPANKHTEDRRTFDATALKHFSTAGLPSHSQRRVSDAELPEHRTHASQPKRRRTLDLRHRANLASALDGLPPVNQTWHIICKGNTPFWQCIPRLIELAAEPIDDLRISTLGFGRDFADCLLTLLHHRQVARVGIVCGHYFKSASAGEYRLLADKLTSDQLATARCHAKVIAATMQSGRGFAFEGSGNLRSCRSIEQMTVTQDPELTRFHQRWIDDLLAQANGQTPYASSRPQ